MSKRRLPPDTGGGVNLGLIVTPFLDFSFQLLFLFVCLYQPSSMEGQIQMRLPILAEKKGDATAPNPGDDDPKLEPEITVKVKANRGDLQGNIGQLLVVRDGRETDVRDTKELTTHLKAIREKLQNKDDFKFQADKNIKMAGVMQVVDACRFAGFRNPAFQEPIPEGAQ